MKRVVFSFAAKAYRAAVNVFVLFCAIVSMFSKYIALPTQVQVVACASSAKVTETRIATDLKDILKDFFGIKKKKKKSKVRTSVLLGGVPLGFTLECDGVLVVAIGSVETGDGEKKPLENKNIRVGDVVKSIDGKKIKSAADFSQQLKNASGGATLGISRGNEKIVENVLPVTEVGSGVPRLGLWVRDNSAGVGTLTYVREDNLRFGALGHPVTDVDTSVTVPVAGGNIYKCSIVGVNKGVRGNPGELRGLFLRSGEEAGVIDQNNDFGVYGYVKKQYLENNSISKRVEVASRDEVKTGKAKILSTIDGSSPEEYDVEIVKVSFQSASSKKSMVLKVTDQRLIEKTGGIVQGMSGSPIIQNGRLVGALTHVFVSDPTKGFGVYIDWMIDN